MKRYRDMTYHGGDSRKEAQAALVMQKRFRLVREAAGGVEAVYEQYEVEKKRGQSSWVACFQMEVAGDIIRGGARPHEARLAAQSALRAAKKACADKKRDAFKTEMLAAVTRRVKAKSSAAAP
jgi:hypothetical protein